MTLRIEHIVQPAVLVDDLDEAMDWLFKCFRAYPSERVDIEGAGVNNAVYPFSNQTYLELIEPYDKDSAAYRLLERKGPGWHMLSVDVCHEDFSAIEADINDIGIRIVQRNKTEHVAGTWHLHPRDTGGVLLNLADPADHDEHGMWAGWAWRQYVATNSRVVDRILGVSLVTEDLGRTREAYGSLGFEFGRMTVEDDDNVIEARCQKGTFLQIRQPRSNSSRTHVMLERNGPGLYHLCWGTRNLDSVRQSLQEVNAAVAEDMGKRLWTNPHSTLISVPMEFRQL